MTRNRSTTARGRRERPVPPGPLQEFAQGLRDLRWAAGNPSYRAMERKAGYSASALSAAAAGDRLPSLAVTQAYVGACGGDQDEWTRTWHALRADLDRTRDTAAPRAGGRDRPAGHEPAASPDAAGRPAAWPGRRAVTFSAILTALGVIALVTAGVLGDHPLFRAAADTPAGTMRTVALQARETLPDFADVAGPSCPHDGRREIHMSGDGWKAAEGSGWTGAGCGDTFLFSDLTYDPGAARHPRNGFQWRFSTGLSGERRCTVAVYIPESELAGQRVWYTVRDGFGPGARTVAEFTLDQEARRGEWFTAPAPAVVAGGQVMVEITDTGRGNSDGRRPMVAGPVRLTCP